MSKFITEDVAKVLSALSGNKVEASASEVEYAKNANEIMHTGNTGFGKELIPLDVLQQEIVDMIPQYSTFLGELPGYHGTNLPVSAKVPIIGEAGFFSGNTEPTTGALGPVPQATHRVATGEVTISQGQFIASVALSKRELNYAINDLEALVKERLARSAARTIEALILNADTTAASTGNVNSDDGTPDSGSYYLQQDNGLRKLALADSINGGTLDIGDLLGAMQNLGDLSADPSQLLWIFNRATYIKALGLEEFYKANERGQASTISGNAITNVFGADLFTARDMPKTEADGRVSVTPSNNTKGAIGLLYKPAVQWGYGQPLDIEVERVPGRGVNVVATFEFGFSIVDKKAGQTDSSVALIRNITL